MPSDRPTTRGAGAGTSIDSMYDLNAILNDQPNRERSNRKAFNENHFVAESLRLISVALALSDAKAAKEI